MNKTFPLLLLFLIAVACNPSKKSTSTTTSPLEDELSRFAIYFEREEYLSDVLAKAEKEDKLVFVDFYAEWCAPCKVMDDELYTNENLAAIINKDFVSLKVDVEQGNGPNLKTIFSVHGLPSLLFLDKKGNILVRHDGAVAYTRFLELAQQAVDLKG